MSSFEESFESMESESKVLESISATATAESSASIQLDSEEKMAAMGMGADGSTVEEARDAEAIADAEALIEESGTEAKDAGMNDENNIIKNIEYIRPFEIGCRTEGDDSLFHGVPGSEFSVKCPPGCAEDETPVYGNAIY
jgi:hypothetical protein